MKLAKFTIIGAALLAAACVDSTGPRNARTERVGLTFGVMAGAGDASKAALVAGTPSLASTAISGDTLVVTAGSDVMRITEVLLTIEEIELENDSRSSVCSDSSGRRDSTLTFSRGSDDDSRDSSDSRSDDCDEIGGPALVNLHLDGKGTSQINVPVVLGVYDTLQFDFDVADESSTRHAAYRAAHPEMANASARITGTFNGSPFQIKLDSRLKYEIALTMPLVVTESSTGFELGIQVDVGSWLTRGDGSLINPLTLCSIGVRCAEREIIEENMDNARVRADGRRR